MIDSHDSHFRIFGFSGFPAFAIRIGVSVVCLRRPLNHADIVSTGKTPRPPRQVQSRKPETSKKDDRFTRPAFSHFRVFGLSRFIRVCILGVLAVIQKSHR